MAELHEYEEHKRLPQILGWMLLILLSASLIGYGLWVHSLVPDQPRQWDFGALPQTPAESVYSSVAPSPEAEPPRQVAPLPEARPLPPKAGGEEKNR